MRHLVDAVLRAEARTFALRFACDDCAHFAAKRQVCAHGYTERPSLSDLGPESTSLAFCKEFELDGGGNG